MDQVYRKSRIENMEILTWECEIMDETTRKAFGNIEYVMSMRMLQAINE